MEWIDSLTKEQLRSLLHTAASELSSLAPSIRTLAKEPLSLTKYDFLYIPGQNGLPKNMPVCLKLEKAQKWIDNCDKYVLSNTIIILKAVSEAVVESVLHGVRPNADLFV